MATLPASAARVQAALAAGGFAAEIVTFPAGTRTAAEAASSIGCRVAQIAKSLLFRGRKSGRPVLVVASGAKRVDEGKVAAAFGEPIERGDAAFVRRVTGYAIGGVPPLAHAVPPTIFIDADLAVQDPIWAAAGAPDAVFRTSFADLLRMTGAPAIAVA